MKQHAFPAVAVLGLAFQLLSLPVFAGTEVVSTKAGAQASTAPSTEADDLWHRDTLLGELGGYRTKLSDHGIVITPLFTAELMGNLGGGSGAGYSSGGVGRGLGYAGLLNVPVDVDLSKMVDGWKGATFHVNGLWTSGPGLSPPYLGDIGNTSNIQAYNTVRLQELWFQQTFLEEKLSLRVGEMAADAEFFTTSTGALFLNSTFGAFTLLSANLTNPYNPPSYPMAAPGVRLRAQPRSDVYVMAGIYDGNTESQTANKHGTDFHLNSESGAAIFTEAGYLLNADHAERLQGAYKFGSFVHTHNWNSWQSQAAAAAGTGTKVSGGVDALLYGVIDQQVYRRGDAAISVYTRAGHGSADRNAVDWYVDGGFNFAGFVPDREKDVFGVAVTRSSFSGNYSDYQLTTGAAANPYVAETTIEATYRFQLTPWWTLQPDYQHIFTPGGIDGAKDADVLGLRTSVAF
ncbi:porin, OprB family [Verrucomicrobium sp. GAS474]|uniref:carbohydrate porin n=1 Tax=Verrucomicrobium sp. GAS474 TaxID=1882831 RepID=UPI00087C574A|nr:carbohydrate porin [Verrucomicrobium sp. GAS474]SDU07175.1 porin, OprB family [Verrucomicrobium sp. GAS474]